MKKTVFKVGKKPYQLKYGFGAIRLLTASWGLKTMAQVGGKINEVVKSLQGSDSDIDIEAIGSLVDIVLAGIYNQDKELTGSLDPDAVATSLLEDPAQLVPVLQLLAESMPQPKAAPSPKKPGK